MPPHRKKKRVERRGVLVTVGSYHSHLQRFKSIARSINMTLMILSGNNNWTNMVAVHRVTTRDGFFIVNNEIARANLVLPSTCYLAGPPISTFQAFDSIKYGKLNTMNWLHDNHFEKYAIKRYKNLSDVQHFPVTVKPIIGTGGVNIRYATSSDHLRNIMLRVNPSRYLIEEAIENHTEWGVHFSAFRGELLMLNCTSMVFSKTLFVRDKRARGLKKVKWIECPAMLWEVSHSIVKKSDYSGFGCMGYKYIENVPKLIEVNARICGMALSRPQIGRDLIMSFYNRSKRCLRSSY